MGEEDLLTRAINFCASDQQDIAIATSILNWLCSEIPNSTASLLLGVTVTDPTQWPGWSTIRFCVESAVWSVVGDIGCGDWTCVCEQSSTAAADLVSRAIGFCSSDEQDVAAATSIFNGFCSQLPGVTDFQQVAVTTAPVPGAAATVTTAAVTGSSSLSFPVLI